MKTAAEIMNADVPSGPPGDGARKAIELTGFEEAFASKHHNHLPVVDADGRLAGMVPRADALAALVDDE
jgi:CBS-domain-containing membrane protein